MLLGTLLILLAFPITWGSGPIFKYGLNNVTGNCLDGWWTEVLYLSNQREAGNIVIIS